MTSTASDEQGGVPSDTLNDVAVAVAQKNAMGRGGRTLQHGTRLFPVASGWESKVIAADQGVAVADTLLVLEAAFKNPDVKVIFVPHDALMTDGDIEKICARNGATRTIFRETKET